MPLISLPMLIPFIEFGLVAPFFNYKAIASLRHGAFAP
jgi:hypothetical protein